MFGDRGWNARENGRKYAQARIDGPITIKPHWSDEFKLGILDIVDSVMSEDQGDHLEPFWVVWNPDVGSPSVLHPTCEAANTEAGRLARENPGQNFFVLGVTDRHIAIDRPVKHVRAKRRHVR